MFLFKFDSSFTDGKKRLFRTSVFPRTIAITVAKQGKAALQKKPAREAVTANTTKEGDFLDVNVFTLVCFFSYNNSEPSEMNENCAVTLSETVLSKLNFLFPKEG